VLQLSFLLQLLQRVAAYVGHLSALKGSMLKCFLLQLLQRVAVL
jgi:hypothetical protein